MKQKTTITFIHLALAGLIAGWVFVTIPSGLLHAAGTAPAAKSQAKTKAQSTDNPATGGVVPCGNTADNPCTIEHIFNIFVIVTNYLIGVAGLIAIISIVWSGFSMVMSAGNTEGVTAGKQRLTNSIIGLLLVLLAFVIINAILYGTLGIGVFNGTNILTDPGAYINGN